MVSSSWTLPWNYNCHSNSCGKALQYWSLFLACVRISEQFKVKLSSDTQRWFRSLHQPLGQLVEFPSMYLWINSSFHWFHHHFRMSKMTNENDPCKRAVIWLDRTLKRFVPIFGGRFKAFLANCLRGWCCERNRPWYPKMILVRNWCLIFLKIEQVLECLHKLCQPWNMRPRFNQ